MVAQEMSTRSVNEWVPELIVADKQARVVVLGDLNDFEFSETTDVLERDAPGSECELDAEQQRDHDPPLSHFRVTGEPERN